MPGRPQGLRMAHSQDYLPSFPQAPGPGLWCDLAAGRHYPVAAVTAATAAVRSALLSLGGGGHRRGGRWRVRADHRKQLLLQLALLQTGLTSKSRSTPLEGKKKEKEQRDKDGRKGKRQMSRP